MAKKGKIDDRVWRELRKRVEKASAKEVKVGLLQSKGGDEETESGATLIDIGIFHEFGAPNAGIPERSFLRRTFTKKKSDLAKFIGSLAKKVVEEKMPVERALELLGEWGASEVRKTITTGPHIPPPLKPGTVARKGSSRPLVDTGRLAQAISYEVVRKGS